MVLYTRPNLAIGKHRGTLAYIRWDIRLECARAGEGDKVVGLQLHVYIHRAIEPYVCDRDIQILYL